MSRPYPLMDYSKECPHCGQIWLGDKLNPNEHDRPLELCSDCVGHTDELTCFSNLVHLLEL